MTRRLLVWVTVSIVCVGIAAVVFPFFRSLFPNDNARAEALTLSLSDVPPGYFTTADWRSQRIFLIHTGDDKVVVLSAPVKNGTVLMPDEKWWRPYKPCDHFGPKNVNGRLVDGGSFACWDDGLTEYETRSWLWDSKGKYAGPPSYPVEDMYELKFERRGTQVLVKVKVTG